MSKRRHCVQEPPAFQPGFLFAAEGERWIGAKPIQMIEDAFANDEVGACRHSLSIWP
jgi:hypothetical protein